MKICWVTNDVWYSKLLRFLFNETTSHVGTLWNINTVDLAIDQNRPVGSMYSAKYWLHKYRIIHQVELTLPEDKELELFKCVEARAVLRKYDMGGYYYGMVWGLLHKVFGLPLPKINKWSRPDEDMCQEIISSLLVHRIVKDAGVIAPTTDLSTMTPDATMHYMKKLTENKPLWKWTHNA
jgi:hypothetical protein